MLELLIANKESGKIWDVANVCTSEVCLSSERSGTPTQLTFTVYLKDDLRFSHGDIVRFSSDGKLLFYGYIFTLKCDRWGHCEVTAYDRVRYLKTNATYAFYALTAGEIIQQIAGDLQLSVGEIEDTGYRIPSLIESDKSCLDIIQDAINQTLLNTGKVYVFFDDGNGLALKMAGTWLSNVVLGERSQMTDFSYQTDIDTNVYNQIKLAQPNESSGKYDVVIAQDSANIERWGLLQLYQTVDGNYNTAQLAERAKQSLAYYNKVHRTLDFEALGVDGLRAGMMVRILLPRAGFDSLAAWVLIESITHTYGPDSHTMTISTLELNDDLIGRTSTDQ